MDETWKMGPTRAEIGVCACAPCGGIGRRKGRRGVHAGKLAFDVRHQSEC
jgi:hypothetical protein